MTPQADGEGPDSGSGDAFEDRFDRHVDEVLGGVPEESAGGAPDEARPADPADRDGARTIVQAYDYAVRMLTGAPLPDDPELDFQTPEGRAEFFAVWVEPAYAELREAGVEVNPWVQAAAALLLLGALAWAEGAMFSDDESSGDSGGGMPGGIRPPKTGGDDSSDESSEPTLAEEKAAAGERSGAVFQVGERADR